MAPRPTRFHVVPADNTFSIAEFDVFQTVAKAPRQRYASTNSQAKYTIDSAVHQVFHTTELIELILLDDNIRMDQLFVLQRVSKRLQNVIKGSQKLQVKMFGTLACTSKDVKLSSEELLDQLFKDGVSTMFNPLMGLSSTDAPIQLPVFRHFNFKPERKGQLRISLVSSHPFTGVVEKKLQPHLGGSWKDTRIANLPLMLEFQFDGVKIHRLSFGPDAVMGNLVDGLSTWYSEMCRHRLHHRALVADVYFD